MKKQKINEKDIYKVCVKLRISNKETTAKEFEYKSNKCPWLDIPENNLHLAEITGEYIEDIEFQVFDIRNIHEIIIKKDNDIIQILTLNNYFITEEEIEEIKKDNEEV